MRGLLCYVTCKDREEAARIARAVVAERLAASANVLGQAHSVYRWRGEVREAEEVALVIKTRVGGADRLVARVRELHGYECPGIVVLPIVAGHAPYLDWLGTETDS